MATGLKDWLVAEWRRLLGEHDESMTSHDERMDPVDEKILELQNRTTAVERILALYEAERRGITIHKRDRQGRQKK